MRTFPFPSLNPSTGFNYVPFQYSPHGDPFPPPMMQPIIQYPLAHISLRQGHYNLDSGPQGDPFPPPEPFQPPIPGPLEPHSSHTLVPQYYTPSVPNDVNYFANPDEVNIYDPSLLSAPCQPSSSVPIAEPSSSGPTTSSKSKQATKAKPATKAKGVTDVGIPEKATEYGTCLWGDCNKKVLKDEHAIRKHFTNCHRKELKALYKQKQDNTDTLETSKHTCQWTEPCDGRSVRYDSLPRHVIRHFGLVHICPKCNQKYADMVYTFKKHLKICQGTMTVGGVQDDAQVEETEGDMDEKENAVEGQDGSEEEEVAANEKGKGKDMDHITNPAVKKGKKRERKDDAYSDDEYAPRPQRKRKRRT